MVWFGETFVMVVAIIIVNCPCVDRCQHGGKCNDPSYIITMARHSLAGRGGRGGGGRGGRGGRFPKRNEPGSLPCKSGEVGACKDLKGNVFTIGSGNKGKDGDMLCTSKEKLALYIGKKK